MEASIDYEQIEKIILDEMADYFLESNFSDQLQEADRFHLRRYVKSISWLQDIKNSGNRVLELGGPSISTRLLHRFFPELTITNSDFELQEPFPYRDKSFDLVINMEVIEHIFDIETLHETTLSGVKHVLSECFRILDDNGSMFLTTPNASSLWVIKRALLTEPPLLYERHFREFTFTEIVNLLKQAGFYIEKAATEQVWHLWDFSEIELFIREKNYPAVNRGDCTFVVANKSADASQLQYQTESVEPDSALQAQTEGSPPVGFGDKIKSLLKRSSR